MVDKCRCCADVCRKRKPKKRGAKKPKVAKQPSVSISFAQPKTTSMPRLAPTFQSSISTPLSEQQRGAPMPGLLSRRNNLMQEMNQQTKPERKEMGAQTVSLAGAESRAEERERSERGLPGESRSEYRIRTFTSQ